MNILMHILMHFHTYKLVKIMVKVWFCAFIQYLEKLYRAAEAYFSWSGYVKIRNSALIFIFKIFIKAWAQMVKYEKKNEL